MSSHLKETDHSHINEFTPLCGYPCQHRDKQPVSHHRAIPCHVYCIGVNRPSFGGTVPHFHQMSRVKRNETDVPHF